VYVQSFPAAGGGKWQISKEGGTYPRWGRDGRELFYFGLDSQLMVVSISGGAALTVGAAVPLFELSAIGGPVPASGAVAAAGAGGFLAQYDVAPNGRQFLVNVAEDSTASTINVMLNWTAALNK
jgi:hypothetical protein